MTNQNLVLLGVGDVSPSHEPVEAFATLARPTLATGDIRIAQCERVYSERGALQVHSTPSKLARNLLKPHMAAAFDDFNVVSLAGNHSMDWGGDAMLDTIELLRKKTHYVIGAGRNLDEARQPAIIEKNDVRVAILAYCAVLRDGYWATANTPGVAPLRVHTYYEKQEHYPGYPPRVFTTPYEEDLADMVEDIGKAKKAAHAVVVIMHWGLQHIPRVICDYESIAAKAAFAAGADLIIAHHPHIPKPIAVYQGKVCFHSVGNFMTSKAWKPEEDIYGKSLGHEFKADPEFINLSHGYPDARRGLIAKAIISRSGVERVSFMPLQIDKKLRPEILRNGDERFDEAVKYMDWASEGHNHKFSVEGDEIVVTGS